ncbi:hypothetical protein, partial [Acinetobacter baumannii]|uniref:hypothetical protein n=1 Tax=Acinetobacter baumannii TaxID=470 RepID=UPI00196AE00D
ARGEVRRGLEGKRVIALANNRVVPAQPREAENNLMAKLRKKEVDRLGIGADPGNGKGVIGDRAGLVVATIGERKPARKPELTDRKGKAVRGLSMHKGESGIAGVD